MVYSLLWVMQDFVHQPYASKAYSDLFNTLIRLFLKGTLMK